VPELESIIIIDLYTSLKQSAGENPVPREAVCEVQILLAYYVAKLTAMIPQGGGIERDYMSA